MEGVPFCQRNVRGWVALLSLTALLVLGYAIYLAYRDGEVHGFRRRGARRALAAAQAAPASSPMAPAAQPVAWTRPPQWDAASAGAAGPGAARNVAIVDSVTKATVNGGVRFIGAARAWDRTAFNRAADVIRPSVVNLSAIRPGGAAPGIPGAGPRFADPFDGVPDKMIGQRAFESVGSGVIVDPSGLVVTNHHVVAGASDIVVTRFNRPGRHLTARLVASDPANDLVLLQIVGPGPFPAAKLADSSLVEVGDWVLAVGNPFGLEHTVTSGIISGKRSVVDIGGITYRGLLQTDAPINAGSSGGPLVNLAGEVVGINTAIFAPTGVFNGTGFAIPSNRVGAFVARSLDRTATAVALQRQMPGGQPLPPPVPPAATGGAWLGVGVADMDASVRRKLGYPYAGGAFVNSVTVDSPADRGEVARGDVIVALAKQPVQDTESLGRILSGVTPGLTVPMTVWRRGKMRTLSIETRPGFVTAP
ncbi:MAG: hypothetical protein Kow0092_39640 [Deferrisomatales bacterium]